MQHYCFECGSPLATRRIEHRDREVCPGCGGIHYAQLKVGAAVLIEKDDKLLLLQRNHEPWKGSWMVPAGYVEADEDPREAAVREVLEETGLRVELGELNQVYYFNDDPRGNGVSAARRPARAGLPPPARRVDDRGPAGLLLYASKRGRRSPWSIRRAASARRPPR